MLHSVSTLKTLHLAASDGDIGHVKDVYFDSHAWTVRYLVVNTGAWLLGKEVLIPAKALDRIDAAQAAIGVNLTLQRIKDAPDSDTALPFSRQDDVPPHENCDVPAGVVPEVSVHTPASPLFGIEPVLQAGMERSSVGNHPAMAEQVDFHLRSVHDVIGHTISGKDHEIGRVGDFLVDDADWSIRYFIVTTAIWFGKDVVVPTAAIREVSWDERTVYLTIPRERVKHAPEYHAHEPPEPSLERRLAEYYGRTGETA